jgi:hypothetical protein
MPEIGRIILIRPIGPIHRIAYGWTRTRNK